MKPKLDKLWAAFPDHKQYPTLKDLFTWIGGNAVLNIDEPGFGANGNTCAARLSVAFNKGGYPITRNMINATGVATLGASDKSRVLFRVSDFRKLLGHQFGKPVVDKSFPFGDSFKGKKGIVAFTINF